MCGIFGYVGSKNAIKIVLEGLKKLEYRGYDSAGFAAVKDNEIAFCKRVGKVSILEEESAKLDLNLPMAIAQTRWATHGTVTQSNAHPHFDAACSVAVVHNGIIENHESLRTALREKGVVFTTDTDTEVVAHLVAECYQGDLLNAVQKAVSQLKGAYGLALVHRDHPDQLIAVAHEAPLVIGIGQNEAFLSSDPHAFAFYTKQVIYLSNSEIAVIRANSQQVYNTEQLVDKETCQIDGDGIEASKGAYEHFTLKEIFEQPQTLRNAMLSRFLSEYGTAIFEELSFKAVDLLTVERILILACGTSWHAGCIAAYMIEDKARIPVQVEISSEFRYKNPIIPPGTFVIAISQSGETADTIAAMREVKAKGAPVLALCNVQSSTLAREADNTIFLKAGAEIGVCSTKAFTSQVVTLSLFALLMARMRHMSKQEGQEFLQGILQLPEQVQEVLNQSKHIQEIAHRYAHYDNFFFIGRRYMFPGSLEGALKLKEISYVNANGYPAGEIKHGPIALINEECPTIALCADRMTYDKLINNLMEIKARHGKVIAVASTIDKHLEQIADDVIYIPPSSDELAVIPATVVTQLFAYYIAQKRGSDIDHPRNLAKSVTVE